MPSSTKNEPLIHDSRAGIEFFRRPPQGVPDGVLLLLHGIGSNAHSFEPLLAALPASIDAIAWNAPGYGASRPLAKDWPVPRDYAAALETLLDALDVPRVTLLGHSLGALFAASFAAEYPARVLRLALVSPALGYRVAPGAVLPANVQSRIDDLETLGPAAFAAKRAPRLVHKPERRPEIASAVERAMAAVHHAGYVQAVRALGSGDLIADAARITAPTFVAVGGEDVIAPPETARRAHAALAHPGGYHELADTGHALPQESPEALAALLAG